jgi:hypothetical protein
MRSHFDAFGVRETPEHLAGAGKSLDVGFVVDPLDVEEDG